MTRQCWIHTGRSRSLCARHKRAVRELAAKRNISERAAAFELRDFEEDVEDARRTLAREFRDAIRVIGDGLKDPRLTLDLETTQELRTMARSVNAIAVSPRGKIRATVPGAARMSRLKSITRRS
jgi:hypothetical protein